MHDLIARVVAEPFAGAFLSLRALDPLYQAEIGVAREWEVKGWLSDHYCNCKYCGYSGEQKVVIVEAITAAEAVFLARAEMPPKCAVDGVRVRGSRGAFADVDDLPAHAA